MVMFAVLHLQPQSHPYRVYINCAVFYINLYYVQCYTLHWTDNQKTFYPKLKNTDVLKKVLQLILDQLPQDSISKAILSFIKTHQAFVKGENVLSEKLFNDPEH